MKKIYIISGLILSLFIFISCTDNTNEKPQSGIISPLEEKKSINENNIVSQSEIQITKNNIDMGEIPMSEGKIKIPFEFINTGTENIILGNAKTTCMCTEAVVVDVELKNPSKNITMQIKGPALNLSRIVKPGEKAFIIATYDPNTHGPDAVGPIDRSVLIKTNSEKTPELRFQFYGDVTKTRSKLKVKEMEEF